MHSYHKKADLSRQNGVLSSSRQISDHRPQAAIQKKLQDRMNNSPQVIKSAAIQSSIDSSPMMVAQRKRNADLFGGVLQQKKTEEEQPKQLKIDEDEMPKQLKKEEEPVQLKKDEEEKPKQLKKDEEQLPKQLRKEAEKNPLQKKENETGMPGVLKSGIENLSGMSMDDVNVHYNSSKPVQVSALAFAQGNDIHLGPGQEKHLPHEAWHVVQQRQGRVQPTLQMKGTAINDDSALEKEADVMGQKAMGNMGSTGVRQNKSNNFSGNVIQLYTDVLKKDQKKDNWDIGSDARVADTGNTVTSNQDSYVCYAIPWMIGYSNNLLKAKGSGIEIAAGAKKVKGPAPDGTGVMELTEVVPTIKVSTSVSGTQNFWTDCGRSSREVMGKSGTDTPPGGIFKDNAGKLQQTTSSKNPGNFRDEILINAGLGSTAAAARTAYLALSSSDKDDFDKKHKINKYTAPEVGEAFVSRRDDASTMKGFNFHWGGVIMTPGNDRVTLENFAKSGTKYDTKDEKWYFETYGPASKPGQTFHERNEGSVGEKGKNNTTMSASTAGLQGKTSADISLFTNSDPKSLKVADLKKGTAFTITDRLNFWVKISVTSGVSIGKSGWINKSSVSY